KSKLLLIISFILCLTASAQWSQVGNTQFSTQFASLAEFTFDANGNPYVVYEDASNTDIYVMQYNGASWSQVGAVVSTENYNNVDITINPITGEPWVALKADASGAASNVDVLRYNGTGWVTEGVNIGGNFYTRGIFLNFDNNGVPRVTGVISAGGSDRRAIIYTKQTNGTWTSLTTNLSADQMYIDMFDENDYVMADRSGRLIGQEISTQTQTSILVNGSKDYSFISGYRDGTEYFAAAYNITDNRIDTGRSSGAMSQPINVTQLSSSIVHLGNSSTNSRHYLMYDDTSNQLNFERYNPATDTWSSIVSPSISTSATSFFATMEMNPVDGNMYILYQDNGRLSMQQYTVAPPLPRYYVDASASGNGSGDSWANAINDLQIAIANASSTTSEIWVATGTYSPGLSRNDAYEIALDNLKIYGGFDGTETSISQRDIAANPTILSGDINGNDAGQGSGTRGDNNYHVMIINQANNVTIDGFDIRYGHANGSGTNAYGGAINVYGQSENLVLRNCTFFQNFGLTGGAIRTYFNVDTNMTIENCVFDDNLSRYGSGMYFLTNANRTVTLDITNSLFINNRTYNVSNSDRGFTGSAMWIRANDTGSNLTTTISNCTFANNLDQGTQSGSERGPLALGRRNDGSSSHNATINNSIFYFNDQGNSGAISIMVNKGHTLAANSVFVNNSISEDSFSNLSFLTNTSNADPLFTDPNNNDFSLQSGSPAIDSGDNSFIPNGITSDLLGNDRIANGTVDMGAYEFGSTAGIEDSSPLKVIVYPNPATTEITVDLDQEKVDQIFMYNLQGQLVKKSTHDRIDICDLTTGIYLVKVFTSNGNSATQKLIKK
ncbi:T9SS type A sorting domain-containing protein, partial [Nonlabens tegetincola]|uniref:T9SS type A sorting domain-containing protein n=1 Tax=Nonlabens tegetincola TaxID=323273 RepID=UPI0030C7CB2A